MGMDTRYSGHLAITPDVTTRTRAFINGLSAETGGPSTHCDFKIDEDGDALRHDGSEKTSDDELWIKLICDKLKQQGHSVYGKIEATVEDGTQYDIIVNDCDVYVQEFAGRGKTATTRLVV